MSIHSVPVDPASCAPISLGAGRITRGTFRARTTTSHSHSTVTPNTRGGISASTLPHQPHRRGRSAISATSSQAPSQTAATPAQNAAPAVPTGTVTSPQPASARAFQIASSISTREDRGRSRRYDRPSPSAATSAPGTQTG